MTTLSILMPVYNVGDVLEEYLPKLLDITKGYDIEIIIGDNNSNDNTQQVLEKYSDKIKYFKNEKNIGGSGNCLKLLSLAKGKYSICIGKNRIFNKELFSKLINLLETSDYDFISVNSPYRVQLPSKLYTDINDILDNLGWHLTLVSSIIFNKRVLKDIQEYEKYIKSELVHSAILYHCVLNKNSKVYFDSRPFVDGFNHKNSASQWMGEVVVYMAKMVDLMTELKGDIKKESRYKWIKDLSGKNHAYWFNVAFYKKLERECGFKIYHCFKYYKYFKYFSPTHPLKAASIVFFERLKINIPKFFFNKTKKGNTRNIKLLGGLINYSYTK